MRLGRAEALGTLFDRYGRLVFTVARRILRDPAEAEDLMQDVFVEVYRKADLYRPSRGSVRTWLMQYTYHRAFNRRKYLALRSIYDGSPAAALADAELAGEGPGRHGLMPHEWEQALRRAMQEIGGKEREMIQAVAFEGLDVRAAAGRISESYMNGRNLYYRGLRKLRGILAPGKEVGDVRS